MVRIPGAFVTATVRRGGEAGRRWLDGLPVLVDGLLERWRCRVDGPPRHGEVALVVPVTGPSGPAVLKVSFPHPGNRSEPGALRQFAGRGAVRLFEADEDVFALLLERARDQTLASEPSAEQAIEISGALARRLAVPAAPGTFSLADTTDGWAEQLSQQLAASNDPPPARAVDRARETISALGQDRTATLLHGDLHDGNVLSADREPWLAIDPKGWRGTAAYDAFHRHRRTNRPVKLHRGPRPAAWGPGPQRLRGRRGRPLRRRRLLPGPRDQLSAVPAGVLGERVRRGAVARRLVLADL